MPQVAAELAVLCEDPDASPWHLHPRLLASLEPAATGLAEGERPAAAVEGHNHFGEEGYSGPLPPVGDGPHRYLLGVFAASALLGRTAGASAKDLRHALMGKEPASGALVGHLLARRTAPIGGGSTVRIWDNPSEDVGSMAWRREES